MNDNKDKEKNGKLKRAVPAALMAGLCLTSVGSYLVANKTSDTVNKIGTGTVGIKFENEADTITLTNAIPMSDDYANKHQMDHKFSIKNTGDVDLNYKIYMAQIDGQLNTLNNVRVKTENVAVDDDNEYQLITALSVIGQDGKLDPAKGIVLAEGRVNTGEIDNFNFNMHLSEDVKQNDADIQGQSATYKLFVIAEQVGKVNEYYVPEIGVFNSNIKENYPSVETIEFVLRPQVSRGAMEMEGTVGVMMVADEEGKNVVISPKTEGKIVLPEDCTKMFDGLDNLRHIKFTDVIDTSNVTNMQNMFSFTGNKAPSLLIEGLEYFDTSKVTNMGSTFSHIAFEKPLTIKGLEDWDTSNVTDMNRLFYQAGNNGSYFDVGDLSKWDVGKVTNMKLMFSHSGTKTPNWSVGDLSQWDTSNVTDMEGMFQHTGRYSQTWFVGDISNWKTSKVTDMGNLFNQTGMRATKTALDLSGWDASNATYMVGMFYECGFNKIMTPKNIRSDVKIKDTAPASPITSRSWYDLTDGGKEYKAQSFPVGFAESHTLVDTNPALNANN